MNKTVTINISGIVFHIEEDAYEKLGKYLQTIRGYFKDSEGREEIMADIEARIAEMFSERITTGRQVVLMADVDHVISVMGQPEDFAGDDAKTEEKKKEEPQEEERRARSRRLYRDPDDRMIGGVCSGLGYYFGIDPTWIRGAFAVAFFFFGTGLLFYILLMIIIPKAVTTAEKLEMRGESVTVDNIRRTVEEEFGHLKKKMNGSGRERRRDRIEEGISDFFHWVFKVFGKLIGVALVVFGVLFFIGLLTAMFGLGSFSSDAISFGMHSVFPTTAHYTGAIIAAALVVGIPCIMMVYAGVRILFRIEKSNRIINYSALGLWVLGIILASWMLSSSLAEFSDQKEISEVVLLDSTRQDTMILKVRVEPGAAKGGGGYGGKYWQMHERGWHLWQIENETVKLGYPGLHIQKAESGDFELEVLKSAAGRDSKTALGHARRIGYVLSQKDSLIEFSSHFQIGKGDPWRAQEVDMILRVPVGKVIYLHESTRYILDDIPNVSNTWDGDMPGRYWIMTAKGLKCLSDCADIEEQKGDTIRIITR